MRNFCGLAVALGMIVAAGWGQTSSQAKKTTAPTAHKSNTVRRPSTASRSGATPVRRSSAATSAANRKNAPAKKTAVTWRNRQLAPTPDRYREIQQALVSKGYLASEEATGSWNQNSIDALKRFQTQQNLDSSGKINSMSLIALGLGPKRDAQTVQAAAQNADQNR
jgi:hypothetical protein